MIWNMTFLSAAEADSAVMARDGSIVMMSSSASVMGAHCAQAAMQSVRMNTALILDAIFVASIFITLIARISLISLLAISLLGLIFVSMITIISQIILVSHHTRTPKPWMTA